MTSLRFVNWKEIVRSSQPVQSLFFSVKQLCLPLFACTFALEINKINLSTIWQYNSGKHGGERVG
jgi:hypothetical protein